MVIIVLAPKPLLAYRLKAFADLYLWVLPDIHTHINERTSSPGKQNGEDSGHPLLTGVQVVETYFADERYTNRALVASSGDRNVQLRGPRRMLACPACVRYGGYRRIGP